MVVIEAEHMCMTMRGVKKQELELLQQLIEDALKKTIILEEKFLDLIQR